jgi:hypothetical protein
MQGVRGRGIDNERQLIYIFNIPQSSGGKKRIRVPSYLALGFSSLNSHREPLTPGAALKHRPRSSLLTIIFTNLNIEITWNGGMKYRIDGRQLRALSPETSSMI